MNSTQKKTVILAILDGWGISNESVGNSIFHANTPNMDYLMSHYPNAKLLTHGEAVGLPPSQVGNSEVGHMNLGAGRKMLMDLPRVNRAVSNNFFKKDPTFEHFVSKAKKTGGNIHLVGLCSVGGVHSHQNHIIEVLKVLLNKDLRVFLHMILDGRDTSQKAALDSLGEFCKVSNDLEFIATISGRFYAMDRDKRWERTKLFFDSIIYRKGKIFDSAMDFIENQYQLGLTDEFIVPAVSSNYPGVQIGLDSIIFMNFRSDRILQIASSLCDPNFNSFPSSISAPQLFSIGASLVNYSDKLSKSLLTFFPKSPVNNTLGNVVSDNNKKQLRIAETEKYAHVTYFFNCGREDPFESEDRVLVPSPKIATYDLLPEMSLKKVIAKLVEAVIGEKYDFIVVNFANPDMVGHTGKLDAAIKACEAVDLALGELLQVAKKKNATILLVADHGNCEEMVDLEKNQPHTSHTLNPVPVILVKEKDLTSIKNGSLEDIAPTLLDLMNLKKPKEMTGKSLLKKT